jgi:D-alanyl-lipoteichoic acid acyltransferase DltB (MBOAT superfamily)
MTPFIQIVAIFAMLPVAYLLSPVRRLILMSTFGFVLLFVLAPSSAWFIGFTCLEGLILEVSLRRLPKKSILRQYLPYILLLNIFYTDLINAFPELNLISVSVGFSVIRIFMTTKQLLSAPAAVHSSRIGPLIVSGYFLPTLVVGPVFSGTLLWKQAKVPALNDSESTEWMYRKMFSGWLLASLVAAATSQLADWDTGQLWFTPFVTVFLFLSLFASFWGQSLIAEAGSSMLGFTVPVNFNKPWLAVDIRDFWNRWHTSMAKFVMQYIYLPLSLRGAPPKVATISAFVFMGLWHEVKIGYLIWGFAHGLCMVYMPRVTKDSGRFVKISSRVATLSLIIILSFVANYAFKP